MLGLLWRWRWCAGSWCRGVLQLGWLLVVLEKWGGEGLLRSSLRAWWGQAGTEGLEGRGQEAGPVRPGPSHPPPVDGEQGSQISYLPVLPSSQGDADPLPPDLLASTPRGDAATDPDPPYGFGQEPTPRRRPMWEELLERAEDGYWGGWVDGD